MSAEPRQSASSWIREHVTPGMVINKAVIAQLAQDATAAGFPCTFAGASSCVYAYLKKKRGKRSVATTPAKKANVAAAGMIVANIAKEFDVLMGEVQRLQRIEQAHKELLAAIAKVK